MSEQEFEDFKSAYLDIYEKVGSVDKEKGQFLKMWTLNLSFSRDEINVAYILQLLSQLVDVDKNTFAKKRKQISDILSGDINLRSKKELIEKFIDETLFNLESSNEIGDSFDTFWDEEKMKSFNNMCEEEQLDKEKIQNIIDEKLFSNQITAVEDKVRISLLKKEGILERKITIPR